ncbi:hypothetical protein HN51_032811 [Arachis hypogaea]|uniref:Transcription factor MYB16 n=1 Tax=Arachis duranensis TaxID=130453 RepID=A0A6P4CA20_ARADU|nr:transcription factor MYB16 [Arachis duranensis]XP_025624106.1 transcription factor MYB16 [Arachis hypogaea]
MGRSPCCDKVGLKKGPWTPEEDQKLLAYIEEHGHGSWRALPSKAGLQRCGKSCRLRWTNYLRPDIKRGKFSLQEEQTIIQLHALLGNRWSAIATHLPKRTDNEIKNYWNTHLKKRLTKMGIDPVTHKPKNDTLLSSDGQSKTAANLSHMAQWESARLEAEARLVRESKLRSHLTTSSSSNNKPSSDVVSAALPPTIPSSRSSSSSIDVLKAWTNGGWLKSNEGNNNNNNSGGGGIGDLESPTSTLSFSENNAPPPLTIMAGGGGGGIIEGHNGNNVKEEGKVYDSLHELTMSAMEGTSWGSSHQHHDVIVGDGHVDDDDDDPMVGEEGFTNLLLNAAAQSDDRSLSEEGGGDGASGGSGDGDGDGNGSDFYEDNKNYWNSILNLVNSSPSDSPMF